MTAVVLVVKRLQGLRPAIIVTWRYRLLDWRPPMFHRADFRWSVCTACVELGPGSWEEEQPGEVRCSSSNALLAFDGKRSL